MSEFVLIGMGEFMDKLTQANIVDVNKRRERMRDKSFETIDSFCMSFCLMVFLGIYLDDAKWAEHGEILDKLFETVLIPLYKFSVYPTHDMIHARSSILDVMDAIGKIYPEGVPPLSEPLPPESVVAPPSPVTHAVITKRYKQTNIRNMFKPVRGKTTRRNHTIENHSASKENSSNSLSKKRKRTTGGTRRRVPPLLRKN
jgi:hypothetical protein